MPRAAPALAAAVVLSTLAGAARAQDPACKAPFERAQELRQEGKLVDARAQLDLCVTACPAELGEQCRVWIGDVEPQIGRLVVVVVDGAGRAQDAAEIQIDGRAVPRAEQAGAIRIDPGEHVVAAAAGGASGRGAITIAPGASERITLALNGAGAAGGAPGGEGAPASRGWFVLGGVGIAGIAAGAALAVTGQVLAGDYAGRCRSFDPACTEAGAASWRSEVEALWIGGGAAIGAGSILLGVALLGAALQPRPPVAPNGDRPRALDVPAQVRLIDHPGGLGVAIVF